MKKLLSVFLLIAFTFAFYACGESTGESNENLKDKLQQEMLMEESGELPEPEHSFYLPSALQIGTIFKRSGLGYMEGITANPENASKYVGKNTQLLNFGVFSADLAYTILNSQSQNSKSLLVAVKELSEGIGFGSVFNQNGLYDRFESNLGNQDSILNLLVEIQENTDVFVSENDLRAETYVIFGGAWVEGMYLGSKAFNKENKAKISKRLVEQLNILGNLISALESTDRNMEDISEVMTGLKGIYDYFNQIDYIRDENGSIDFAKVVIEDKELDEISSKIAELRTLITEV
ncbi:hypothetical protein N9C06_00315 [Salibacteraceae bacterium]|nr:hypothetical protein [Salibacteraceae bacterium]